MTDREIIGLYHAHGECEQFHSEIKSDMDLERLPSGKFTNELAMELAILANNILRMIGQESIGLKSPWEKYAHRKEFPMFLATIREQKQSKYIKLLPLKRDSSKIG